MREREKVVLAEDLHLPGHLAAPALRLASSRSLPTTSVGANSWQLLHFEWPTKVAIGSATLSLSLSLSRLTHYAPQFDLKNFLIMIFKPDSSQAIQTKGDSKG